MINVVSEQGRALSGDGMEWDGMAGLRVTSEVEEFGYRFRRLKGPPELPAQGPARSY